MSSVHPEPNPEGQHPTEQPRAFAWRCRTKGCDRPSSTRSFDDRELAMRAAKNHKTQRPRNGAPRKAHRVEVVEVSS